jgi:predicted secreted Zn-dependent protease
MEPRVMAPLKRFLAGGFTLAVLVFLPGTVHPQNSVVRKTNYYAVGGTTLREIHESFRHARPWKDKSSYDGQTDWRIDWRYQVTPAGENCRCDSFTTQTAITITLPRWTAPTNAAPELREAWISFFNALSKHEEGHAQNAQAAAKEMHERVHRLPKENNCTVLKKKIDEAASNVLVEFRQRDEEFDRQTAHGVRDGAFLPRGRRGDSPRR